MMYLCILLEHFVHQQLSFWDFFEPFLSMKGWFNVKLCKVPFAIQLKKREYDLISDEWLPDVHFVKKSERKENT